jgi:DNA-binding transcriptional ArsR family regulator
MRKSTDLRGTHKYGLTRFNGHLVHHGGCALLQLKMSAKGMAATRFELSPLLETAVAIQYGWFTRGPAQGEPAWGRAARNPEVWRRLPVLSALLRDSSGRIPAYPPFAGVSFPVPIVTQDLQALLRAVSWRPGRGARLNPHTPDRQAKQGTTAWAAHDFARRLVDDMKLFHRLCLAPHWSAITAQAEGDISRRADIVLRQGLAHGWASLHPTVTYHDDTVHIADDETQLDVDCGEGIALVPSTLAHRCLVAFDPCEGRGRCLIYPALRPDADPNRVVAPLPGWRPKNSEHPRLLSGDTLADVLGHTRLVLLRSLDHPRTTAQLAATHHLSPSTVSYHLTRLHRAGLLTRSRDGKSVQYLRTAEADQLLERAGHTRPSYLRAHPDMSAGGR